VTERGVFAAGQDRSHPAAMPVEGRPADRIDTTSNGMKATSCETMFDSARAEAKRQQLPPGHDPMLFAGNFPSLSRARIGH
jgi:hypothetical protein